VPPRKDGWNLTASSRFLKTLYLVLGLTCFSPTSGYPSFDLYRHLYLAFAVSE
jgi:hypothetical protein